MVSAEEQREIGIDTVSKLEFCDLPIGSPPYHEKMCGRILFVLVLALRDAQIFLVLGRNC